MTVGSRPAPVKAIALAAAMAVATGGCFWREYGGRMAMHAEVLVAVARKGADLVRSDRFTPENLPELHYPLDRARAFAARAARRSGDAPPESLRAFVALLDAYGLFCTVADEARRAPRAEGIRTALRDAVWSVRRRAAAVEQALAAEGRGP